ncbi:Vacuolar protein sorting-associated protein 13B, partial [Goodea atripinnis]
TLTSITNLATSLARNMDRLSLDEEHYTRQEEWRRELPESLGDGLRQGLSRLGISLLGLFLVLSGAVAGIVDQPMQNFQKNWEMQSSAGSKAKGVISGVGKGIVGVFTKPIGGAAELVSQTGYGILHGAGLWQLPKQLYLPAEEKSALASNSHLKYVWKMLQSLGRPELHMALEVTIVSGSGQEYAGCLLLTSEVLFVVSLCEDTQQQAFPITEVECQQDPEQQGQLTLTLQQQTVTSDTECYRYMVDPVFAKVFVMSQAEMSELPGVSLMFHSLESFALQKQLFVFTSCKLSHARVKCNIKHVDGFQRYQL